MDHKTPETDKIPGVSYVWTEDGIELSVIDVTHAAFAEKAGGDTLAALSKEFLDLQGKHPFIRRLLSKRSIVLRAMTSASGTFLAGMATYVGKLGPAALGRGYSGFVDRKVAAGIGSVSFRLRLRDMADRMAEELAPRLAARQGRPLRLLNIGGGPAMDSLNALILIRKSAPESLGGRRIFIRVLDVDTAGPAFGSRATEALCGENAPLHGVSVSFDRVEYDWTRPSDLHQAVGKIGEDDVAIGSTEGGCSNTDRMRRSPAT